MKHSNLIGVDVSETSVKVLQLDINNRVTAFGKADLPIGVIEKGVITNLAEFSRILNNLLETTKPNILRNEDSILRAVLCVPESKLFSYYVTVPASVSQADEKAYLYDEASKIIPVEMDSLYSNYHVATENGIRRATFLGIKKNYLNNYIKAFTQAKVEPAFIGGELFAIGRAVLNSPPLEEDCMIVDIGDKSTSIGMFSVDAVPNLSVLVKQGGQYFTEFLASKLAISIENAETMKREFGLDATHEATQVPSLLRECLAPIIDKIISAQTHFEQRTGSPIKHIIISGGSALMPKLDTFIAEKVGVETSIANPFTKIRNYDFVANNTNAVFMTNVIGLAICANQADLAHINFLAQYLEENDEAESSPEFDVMTNGLVQKLSDYRKAFSVSKLQSILLLFKTNTNFKLVASLFALLLAVVILLLVINRYM